MVEMFLLNVQDDGMLGSEQRDGPVAFVAFRDEILSLVPVGVGAEDRNLRADVVGGAQATGSQNVRGH